MVGVPCADAAMGIARVRFFLNGLTVLNDCPPNQGTCSKSLQLTQYLTLTINFAASNGVPPWNVVATNDVVSVEMVSNNVYRVVPRRVGASEVHVVDSRGQGKIIAVNVTPDQWGANQEFFNNLYPIGANSARLITQKGYLINSIKTLHYPACRQGTTITLQKTDPNDNRIFQFPASPRGQFCESMVQTRIPNGTFMITVSDPSTWLSGRSGEGIVIINGQPRN